MIQAGEGMGTLSGEAAWSDGDGQAAGSSHAGHDAEPCANCGTERHGPYCHACGQAGHVHRNLMALVHDLAHGVFHFEGKLWHTLPLLAWRPGELTRRYVHGERAKFISPVALFLFSVFLMFAVVNGLAGHHSGKPAPVDAANAVAKLQQDKTRVAQLRQARKSTTGAARDKLDTRVDNVEDEIDALQTAVNAGAIAQDPGAASDGSHVVHTNTGSPWFDQTVAHMSRNPALTLYKLKSYAYKYSWALIPISLPFIWLLFAFRRGVGLYDHAIFSLSFMSLGVVALVLFGRFGVPTAIISLLAIFVPPLHMYLQLKGAYRLGRWGALWRTVALLVITSITLLLFAAFLFYMGSD